MWLSTAITAVGGQFTVVAVPKQVYDITSSSAYVGLTGLFGLVPLLIFGLWGGAIADAVDRRTVILVSNIAVALTSVAFWLQAAAGLENVWLVLSLLAVQQAFIAVNMPTPTPAVARRVPLGLLPPAAAAAAVGRGAARARLVVRHGVRAAARRGAAATGRAAAALPRRQRRAGRRHRDDVRAAADGAARRDPAPRRAA